MLKASGPLVLVIGLTLVVLGAQPAAALEPGVHIDPGSPAAKEYVLPLSSGRQTGRPASEGASTDSRFGVGIESPGRSGGSRHAAGGDGVAPGGGAHTRLARRPAGVPAAARSQSTAGDGSLLTLLGGGAAILLVGGLGGTVLRRAQPRRPS